MNNRLQYWCFVGVVLLLASIGIVFIYTSSHGLEKHFFLRQFVFVGFGFTLLFILPLLIDWKRWVDFSILIYILCLLPLIFLLFFGGINLRWIPIISGIYIQPSEFMKVGLILMLSYYFSNYNADFTFRRLFPAFILLLIPFTLIFLQPDLSTALTMFIVFSVMLFCWGLKNYQIFILFSPLLAGALAFSYWLAVPYLIFIVFFLIKKCSKKVAIFFICLNLLFGYLSFYSWNFALKDYQKQRIVSFFNPSIGSQGHNYQLLQSKITIGSGGVFGKGLGEGSQVNLDFLPEKHSDFIFSVIGEQLGFIFSVFTISLLFLFLFYLLYFYYLVQEKFFCFFIIGSIALFFFHIVINIGMTLGLFPVTGLPLPFISYGGSFLITCFLLLAIISSYVCRENKL